MTHFFGILLHSTRVFQAESVPLGECSTASDQELAVEPPGKKTSSNKPEDPEDGNQNAPTAWAYASEGTQIAVTLLIGIFVGYKLDAHWGTSPWGTVVGATLGIAVGLYGFLKRAMKW